MNNNKRLTLTGVLALLVAYCLLRFGLVMTAGFGAFGLPLVVFAGAGVVLLYALLDRQYSGRLLQLNVIFLAANILCVVLIKSFTVQAEYVATAANYINQLIVLFILWGFYQYLQRQDANRQRWLVALYVAAVGVSAVYTLYVASNGHSNIIRNTAFGEMDGGFPFVYGGFDFIYGLVLVYAILFTVLKQGKERIKPKSKVYIVLLLLLIAATIIASGFSTAFALILVFTVLNAPRKRDAKIFWLLVVVIFVFVLPEVLTKLIESIPLMPETTSRRINELLLSFTGKGSSSYITDEGQRLDRVLWSLRAFVANPVLGVFGENGTEQLGYHTEWIEQLARYGVFTALFNAAFWVGTYRRMEWASHNMPITQKCIKNAFLLYLVLGFLNPISMVITAAPLFVLCPFAEKLFLTDKRS